MKSSEILLLLIIVVAAVFGPLIVIWALNTLFALNIEYSFINWLATAILSSLLSSRVVSGK